MKPVKVGEYFIIDGNRFNLIGGPCSIESEGMAFEVAGMMKDICSELGINFIFKSSFDKANRSSIRAGRAIGMEKGLEILGRIRADLKIPVTTDVHETWQCGPVGEVVDILQIPAYLCRQTDLILAAAGTGKTVSIKKGQFMAPQNMDNVIEKVTSTGNENCILMERGSTFGYNRLVVDTTGIPVMRAFGYPVFIDATHSVQEPGGNGTFTRGSRKNAEKIMYAALAVGVDGVFAEIHPNPEKASSDIGSQLKLSEVREILQKAVLFDCAAKGGKMSL